MHDNRRPRRRSEPPSAPTSLHEIARRYVGCAVQLAKALGVPYTEAFLVQHRESVSCLFIEASKIGLRLPGRVTLPPLAPDAQASPKAAPPSVSEGLTESPDSSESPQPEPDRDQLPPGEGAAPVASTNGDAPLPTRIPTGDSWPCSRYEIAKLKPAQLHLVLAKAGFRAHADTTLIPLLAALQIERSKQMERGARRNGHQPWEASADDA